MTKTSKRLVTTEAALDALGLLTMPHDVAPFGDAELWVTEAYDADGNLLGFIRTEANRKGVGLKTSCMLRCAAPTALEGRQSIWL